MQPFSLSMVEGTGSLLIRDAAEPYELQTPTVISGDHDTGEAEDGVTPTGAVTTGTFSSPAISFQTMALGFDVFVDAAFSQVTPGSGTGVIDADGNVRLTTALTVDLHIEVSDPPIIVNDCRATPVDLVLESTAPWDPDTRRVTVADADFSVPAVPITDDCVDLVADNVNELLGGGGHSLAMTLEGDLTLPPAPGCPTLAEVEVAPEGVTGLGDEVILTATVAADPAFATDPLCEDAEPGQIPAGIVAFRAGTETLGTAELDGTGTATFTTSRLPVGAFDLTARYRGSPPFAASASVPVEHQVTAKPTITVDMPPAVRIEADPVEFDITVDNSTLGRDLANARVQMALRARSEDWVSGGSINSALEPVVQYSIDGGPFLTTSVQSSSAGSYVVFGPDTGAPLPGGDEVTITVRLSLAAGTLAAPAVAVVELMVVDPVAGTPAPGHPNHEDLSVSPGISPHALATTRVPFDMVNASRYSPPWSATIQPHTLRQGQTVRVNRLITSPSTLNSLNPVGMISVELDGKPVPVRLDQTSPDLGYLAAVEKTGGAVISPEFVVPDDAPPGTLPVTVRYAGNAFFEPAVVTGTVTVLPSRGVTYTCALSHIFTDRFTVNLTATGFVAAVAPAGRTLELAVPDVAMYADRGPTASNLLGLGLTAVNPTSPAPAPIQAITFGLSGGAGTGTAEALTTANLMPLFPGPADPATVDLALGFDGEAMSVNVEGSPGEVVPVTLDRVRITGTAFATIGLEIDCEPLGDPVTLGQVTVAGTTLSVDAPSPTRAGDAVTLSAQVQPLGVAGPVEFFDGETSIGMTAVHPADGTAAIVTTALGVGTHSLSARFYGGVALASTTSEPVSLVVLVATECAAFAEDGNEAVVRLVYMELLGRCPDRAGFDYWVGRLDGGASPEAFARSIAGTSEAVGRVVDDAYGTMLGRSADASGRGFWTGRLQGHGRYDTLLADLGASGEFWSQAGSSNSGFVTRVYERLLNRAPEQAGLDYWVGRLDAGTSRRALIVSLANLDEPLGVLVAGSYSEILSRGPSGTERGDGIVFLRRSGDRSGLYAQLIGRPEFSTRAQGFPNPED